MQALFLYTLRKTQVGQKLRFLPKLRYLVQNSGPKNEKGNVNRKVEGKMSTKSDRNSKILTKLCKTQIKIAKLRSIFKKLRSKKPKNLRQPQIHCNQGAGKVSKKKACLMSQLDTNFFCRLPSKVLDQEQGPGS